MERLQAYWHLDIRDIQDEAESTRTERLLQRAYRLDVPAPPPPPHESEEDGNEWWQWGTFGLHLTTTGINKLRTEIRAEVRARREARSYWLIWLTALTGVIGALTGLLAVVLKR